MSEQVVYKTAKKIDISTGDQLTADLNALADKGKYELIIDMSDTVYISSVGLRALLNMQKKVNSHEGTMIIRNACEMVRKVFEVTGFDKLFTIE